MIRNIDALRTKYLAADLTPDLSVVIRRLVPGWERWAQIADNYLENPDVRGGSARLGVVGTFQRSFGGFNAAIAGDSDSNGNNVIRVLFPQAYGDLTEYIYIYAGNDFSVARDAGSQYLNFEQAGKIYGLGGSLRPKSFTRGGIYSDVGATQIIYIDGNGSLRRIRGTPDGTSFYPVESVGSTPQMILQTTNRYNNVFSATVAPVGADSFFVCYSPDTTQGKRVVYLDFWYNGSFAFTGRVLGYIYDEEVVRTVLHWFDASPLPYNTDSWVLVYNTSARGASRAVICRGGMLSEPITVLPFDDLDWNGTIRIASLSVVNNRVWAFCGQRFVQGDKTLSREVWSLLWSVDGEHWAQAPHYAMRNLGVYPKLLVSNDYALLVSPTTVYRGVQNVEMGASVGTHDASYACSYFSMSSLGDGSGSNINFALDTDAAAFFETHGTWKNYTHQMAYKLDDTILKVGWISGPQHKLSAGEDRINMQARGSLSRVYDYTQFTDDILDRGIQDFFDMEDTAMVNRDGSVWSVTDKVLVTEVPNPAGEYLVSCATQLNYDFEAKAYMSYESQSKAFGIFFWTGLLPIDELEWLAKKNSDDTAKYTVDDLHNHWFYFLRCTPDNGNVTFQFVRRTATVVDGEWVNADATVGSSTMRGWSTDTYRQVRVYAVQNTIYAQFHNGTTWENLLSYTLSEAASPRFFTGLYAKSARTKVASSVLTGSTIIVLENALDWPTSGEIKVGSFTYSYTRSDNVLSLATVTKEYINGGTYVAPANSEVRAEWYLTSTSHKRWNVADVCKHLCVRSGINLNVDNLIDDNRVPFDSFRICNSIGTWNTTFFDARTNKYTLGVNGAIDTGIKTGNTAVSVDFEGMGVGDWIEIALWSQIDNYGTGNLGHGFVLRREQNGYSIELRLPDKSVHDSTLVKTLYHEGRFRVAVLEGWAYFYFNDSYLGALHKMGMKGSGSFAIRGDGVSVTGVIVDAGNEMVAPGIWDGQSPARNVLDVVTEGLPIVITETENVGLRLQHIDYPDDLGTINLNLFPGINYTASSDQVPSAIIVEGGYSWSLVFSDKVLRELGLRFSRHQNNSLQDVPAQEQYAASIARRVAGELSGFGYVGRFDPAMQIRDTFTVPSFRGYDTQRFIVTGINVTCEPNAAVFNVRGEAMGAPYESDTGAWTVDTWGDFDWS